MRILIEEYPYRSEDISETVLGELLFHDAEGKVSLDKVGYYFNPKLNDCVFILPKVLLEGERGKEKVFGHIEPRDLVNPEKCTELSKEEYRFIYNLSVWIYRALCVFREHEYDRYGGERKRPSIILFEQAPMMGRMKKRKASTFLDILLALLQWNRQNQQFVMFIVKNLHSGYNKINWTKTINRAEALVQNNVPMYVDPVNKRRQVNFDEELLIIYYSILNHIHLEYGLPVSLNVNFPLIRGEKFRKYINGQGKRRLRQIKYKYFSDKALELWELCNAFFEQPQNVNLNVERREYLLAKNFHIVFEAIIDELIAGDQQLPKALKDQEDGKVVDHIYQYRVLTNNETDDETYYIGDSKYYKRGRQLQTEAVYKQFTYARNVVQWNLDLFSDGTEDERKGHIKLRDDVTEGYNIIPNFFISAQQNDLTADDKIELSKDKKPYHLSRQFENRIFDRDTYMLAHYDVNFLFVLALYGRNKEAAKTEWREKARRLFRKEIQEMLEKYFTFYAMTAHPDVDSVQYLRENFQTLLGKVFQPFESDNNQQYYSLALRNPEKIELADKQRQAELRTAIADENDAVMFQLEQAFIVKPCPLGVNPKTVLPSVAPVVRKEMPKQLLTMHHLENYPETSFLIGIVNDDDHLRWIYSREGGKRDDAYNVRVGKTVSGGVTKSRDEIKHAKFVVLYLAGKAEVGVYKTFRVKNIGELTKEQMIKTGYKDPGHDKYLCYFFDEEVTIGKLNIERIIEDDKAAFFEAAKNKPIKDDYPEGRPIYLTGAKLIEYRLE
ncbi:MAG: LlaJI family restriction endonuclease [Bacteroidales bacterium]|nr:LlaJI family restriction endonuclease [Bacteroidales bacterium]